MKDKLFQIFFCFFIFWNNIISTYLSFTDGKMNSDVMRSVLMTISVISWLFYLSYSNKSDKEFKMLSYLILFGVVFYCTRYYYPNPNIDELHSYNGQILRWGASSVSACLLGMIITKLKSYDLIHKILPIEILLLTLFMVITVVIYSRLGEQINIDAGMNYQTIAYSLAVLFCLNFYYVFLFKDDNKLGWIMKLIMMAVMPAQMACCAMAGGRGGLILLEVYIVCIVYYILKHNILSKSSMIFVAIISTVSFIFVANYLELWDSLGFQRSSDAINNDDRFELWFEYLPFIERRLIGGYGIGGDYFTWGFYSHNIIIDWLVETGIVGTIVISITFWKSYKILYLLTKRDSIFVIIMILSIGGVVMNMFSGYWISTEIHWMVFGVVISRENFLNWGDSKLLKHNTISAR